MRHKFHTEASVAALKNKAAVRRAFAAHYTGDFANVRAMIAAGYGHVKPSDVESAARAESFPHPLWAESWNHRQEHNALFYGAWARWGRDIAETLKAQGYDLYAKKDRERVGALVVAKAAYADLFASDVAAHPDVYKERVRLDPRGHAMATLDGLELADVQRFTRELRAEIRAVARACA